MSTRKDKLNKTSKIRDKITSQKKIKKLRTSFTLPLKFKRPGTKGNKKMI